MNRCKLLIIPILVTSLAIIWGVDRCRAESQDAAQMAPANGSANTGTFRDPESVPKLRGTTQAQREEAARKAAEFRAEAARAAALKNMTTSGAVPPGSSVPPKVKGGANE